jgi:speckle-type POZ protein
VIDGYSGRKGVDNIKYYFKSGLFNVGGHAWCITYFPQGDETTSVDWISLHLTLVHTLNAQVKGTSRIQLARQHWRTSVTAHHGKGRHHVHRF